MPTVANLPNGIKIAQYYKDHDPPHFHAELPSGAEALIRIADLGIEAGAIPRGDYGMVKAWALQHQAALALNWVLARAGIAVQKVPYP
jgi:hypothetical protein